MSNKNVELTMVFSDLNKRETRELKESLREAKNIYAPKAKASFVAGKREYFQALMQRCERSLNG